LLALEPYRPIFIGLTLLFLGLAFRRLYLAPQVCVPSTPCADSRTVTRRRLTFWMVAMPLLSLLAVPWLAPLFYQKEIFLMRRLLLSAALALLPLAALAGIPQTVTFDDVKT